MSGDVAERADVTDDLFFGGRLKLLQPRRGHRAGSDAALLVSAARSRLTPGAAVADLGAATGAVGLALAVLGAGAVALVEIDPALAALADRNAGRNDVGGIASAVAADVATLGRPEGPAAPAAGSCDLVVANPPFDDIARFRPSPQPAKALAHAATADLIEDWIAAAGRLLKPGGSLVLIHRPEALGRILAALEGPFGDVRLQAVHPRADAPASRILVAARKARRGALVLLPGVAMHGADGGFTPEADAAQRGDAALDMG